MGRRRGVEESCYTFDFLVPDRCKVHDEYDTNIMQKSNVYRWNGVKCDGFCCIVWYGLLSIHTPGSRGCSESDTLVYSHTIPYVWCTVDPQHKQNTVEKLRLTPFQRYTADFQTIRPKIVTVCEYAQVSDERTNLYLSPRCRYPHISRPRSRSATSGCPASKRSVRCLPPRG